MPATGPSIQSAIALSSSSIYVNWSILTQQELNGALQGYQVQYIDTAGQNKSVEVNATVTSAVLTNLTAYTVYNVSVKARTGPGYGPFGATASQRSEEDGECKRCRLCLKYLVSLAKRVVTLCVASWLDGSMPVFRGLEKLTQKCGYEMKCHTEAGICTSKNSEKTLQCVVRVSM